MGCVLSVVRGILLDQKEGISMPECVCGYSGVFNTQRLLLYNVMPPDHHPKPSVFVNVCPGCKLMYWGN